MGEVFLLRTSYQLVVHSVFYFYGEAATEDLTRDIASEISHHWNEPAALVRIRNEEFQVVFEIEGIFDPRISPETVWYNTDPANNYFRIEPFSFNHISFVDGLGCNTGYFKLDNLSNRSTTAAHEYGHTLGLDHPGNLDIRGQGQPGIMYPRGTICDPEFQYDPKAGPGAPGGTLNPATRKVLQSDIDQLKLYRLTFDKNGKSALGTFTSTYHYKHEQA
jgi:hypothetical protein